jgi:ABC-type transporter Mla subunit MlaD
MAGAKDDALLAHLADTVAAMASQLDEHKSVQQTIQAVLQQLLETNRAQSEMLAEILQAAGRDPGPSPVAEALAGLMTTVAQLAENQAILIGHVAALPEAIGRQLEISLRPRPQ